VSPRWSKRLRARLDGTGVRLAICRGWRERRVEQELSIACERSDIELTDVIDALGTGLESLQEQNSLAGIRCDVIVADMWLAYDVIGGDLGELQPRVAGDVVAASFADTLGLKPGELAVCWQAQSEQRQLACALPRSAMDRLRAVLERAGLRLGTVEGELVQTFNANRDRLAVPRALLAVARDGGTQFGLIMDGGVAAVRFQPGRCDAGRLQYEGAALLRCAGLDADEGVHFVADAASDVALPEAWAQPAPLVTETRRAGRLDLDLSRTRSRVSQPALAMMAAGIAATIAAAVFLQASLVSRARSAAEQSELQGALSEAQGTQSGAATPKDARAAKATAAILRDLSVPWPDLIATFEAAARSNVALLAVEPASNRNEVRFTGEAKSSDAMLDYLDALRGATLREVTLVSHQVQAQTPGTPIRFQAQALWTRSSRTKEPSS
jgi:hypothetical protein